MTNENRGPLAGLRVADFSRVLAGPFCTMMLADLGADVIKVERPGKGDDTRHWGPPWFGEGGAALSAYFVSVNRNKRSLSLDLAAPDGLAVAHRLIGRSDVMLESFRPGVAKKLRIDYETVKGLNPALIYCGISGYGQDGPLARVPGHDLVIQSMTGARTAAAAKRSLCPMVQLDSTPPPDTPVM